MARLIRITVLWACLQGMLLVGGPVGAQQAPAGEPSDRQSAGEASAANTDRPFVDRLERLNEEIAAHPDSVAPRFERARLLESQGLPDAAVQDYRWLLNHRPELPEAYNNMARLLAARGDLSQAITVLEQGMATHPVYQLMFANLRSLYEAMASQAYRAALNEPTSPEQVTPIDEEFSVNLKRVESMDTATGASGSNSPAAGAPAAGDTTRMAAHDE